jgi:hypothetical protein
MGSTLNKGDRMNRNRVLAIVTLATIFVLACATAGPAATQVPAQQPTYTPLPTYTPYPTQGGDAGGQPTETAAVSSGPTTASSAPVNVTPSQYFGHFRWFGSLNPVTFVITKVTGTKFTGAMYWTFTQCRITEKIDGDIFTDVTAAPEQNRWALHPDFQSGDKGGTWLRWTQNESIGAQKCYLTISGDWWYGHINSQGHIVGIHFTNATNTVPDKGATFDFTIQQ